MSAQLSNFVAEVQNFLPWVSFVAGLGGSLHCVGMCGGLVTATCERSSDIFRYQIGRLLGYLLLGSLAGVLGSFLKFEHDLPLLSILPSLFIGALFIFWGYQNYRGKKAEMPAPKYLHSLYYFLWHRLVKRNSNFSKAFFTGLISILLPCGLLYGVVLGTVALQHSYEALLSVFFFWLGTVPSMMVAPGIVQRIIRPIKAKLPKTFAISLMVIGLLTITFRINSHVGRHSTDGEKVMKCH